MIDANDGKLSILICATPEDNEIAIRFRQKHFFDERGFQDPYIWTFDQKDHEHFMIQKEGKVIGYAHIQYWPNNRSALRIIVIDKQEQGKGYGSYLMKCCENLLKGQGITLLQTEAAPNAYVFYQKLGYKEMPFNSPDGEPTHPDDRAMGKYL